MTTSVSNSSLVMVPPNHEVALPYGGQQSAPFETFSPD